jgi:hypothetical protein
VVVIAMAEGPKQSGFEIASQANDKLAMTCRRVAVTLSFVAVGKAKQS